ncbi:DUF6056 family protein [Phascolarctobacterium sp.]|uniref:DUF3329 domain-containing protein n=1 Tax=Phascolarctobacterium sp. TaxID=2049039 RepID=UPI002A7FCFAF|nr:DUF6056 family protein [Phascolarctobacterium sp.]
MRRVCARIIALKAKTQNNIYKIIDFVYANKKTQLYLTLALLISLLVGFYLLNKHTTLIVDDYGYSFCWGKHGRVESIQDIILSQYNHYFGWGGRSVVHAIAMFFLMFDKSMFNVSNTLAIGLLSIVIYLHAVGKFKLYPGIIIIMSFSFFSFMPAFGQTFLWLTGACNYLWGPLILLSYLLLYRFQFNCDYNIIDKSWKSFLVFIIGVMAGWTNENTSLALIAMISCFIFFAWYNSQRIYLWQILGLVAAVIGSLVLILAPGNQIRLLHEHATINVIRNIYVLTKLMIKPDGFLYPLTILLLLYCYNDMKDRMQLLLVYGVGFIISVYAFAGAPYFGGRSFSGCIYLITIVICYLYTCIDFSFIKNKKLNTIVLCFFSIVTILNFKTGYSDIKAYESRNNMKVAYTIEEKSKGNLDIIIQRNYPKTKYCASWGLEDINTDINHWTNVGYARYFGIKSVRVK